jgi:hypothetical protein
MVGLQGIKNLDGADYNAITEKIIDKLSLQVVVEVASKIIEYNFRTGEQLKN